MRMNKNKLLNRNYKKLKTKVKYRIIESRVSHDLLKANSPLIGALSRMNVELPG